MYTIIFFYYIRLKDFYLTYFCIFVQIMNCILHFSLNRFKGNLKENAEFQ